MRIMLLGCVFIFSFLLKPCFAEIPLAGTSLFHLQSKWLDQEGHQHTLTNYRGSPIVLSMVYLSCGYTCPLTIKKLKALESKLDDSQRQKVKFLIFSFDPQKDSPQKLKAYMTKMNLDPKVWTMLTSHSESEPRELAAALAFQYQKDENAEFIHSFQITVLDGQGVPRAQISSASEKIEPLLSAIPKD